MNYFFGIYMPGQTVGSMTLVLVTAVVLGGLIGLEREIHGHPAGLRTHILVCVGSALLTLVSAHIGDATGAKADPGRIAAQIVSGIGFLGAGAIIREGATIRGLTTAASIWTTAGVGIALGAGPFYAELAVITTGIVLFTLWILNKVEDRLNEISRRVRSLELQVHASERAASAVIGRVATHGLEIVSIVHEQAQEAHLRRISLRVRLPDRFDRSAFMSDMAEQAGVVSVDLE